MAADFVELASKELPMLASYSKHVPSLCSKLSPRLGHIALLAFCVSACAWGQTELFTPTLRSSFNAGPGVRTMVVSPDGRWGAVGTRDGNVVLFDVAAGGSRNVTRQPKRINALVFNRAGSMLACGGDQGTVALVSLPGGQVQELPGRNKKVLALAFSPEGDLLASAGEDKDITVWNPTTGMQLYRLTRDSGRQVTFLGFNAMGTTLLAVDAAGVISEWDVKNRSRLRQIQDSDNMVNSAAISFSGAFLALGSQLIPQGFAGMSTSKNWENRVKLYDTQTLAVTKTLDNINGEVRSISVSADNRYVAVARERMTRSYLSVYDVLRNAEIMSFPASGYVQAVAFSPDGQMLASATDSGEVSLYGVKGIRPGAEVGDLKGLKYKVTTSQATPIIPTNTKLIAGVIDFDPHGVDPGTAQAVAELLRTRIVSNSKVTLVDRTKMDRLLAEQDFQRSGRADPTTAVRLGKLLGARKMIFGSVSKLGTSMTIHAELIDVETGKIDGSCEVLCQQCAGEDLPEAVASIKSYLIADNQPGSSQSGGVSDELERSPVPVEDYDTPSPSGFKNPHAYALVIGAETYRSPIPEVPFALNDAAVMKRYFESVLGVPVVNIRGLANPALTDLKVGLMWLRNQMIADGTPDAIAYLYYAGHGVPDNAGKPYLLPVDANPDYIHETGYAVETLVADLADLPGRSVVFLDACFTGSAARATGSSAGVTLGKRPAYVEAQLPVQNRVAVLSAVSGHQTSNALHPAQHGLFTYFLLKGLRGSAADAQGRITLNGLHTYVLKAVSDAATRLNLTQTPTLTSPADLVLTIPK